MEEALKEAEKAYEEGEVPVGAVLVKDGKIIARGHNTREASHEISGHAEIACLEEASRLLNNHRLNGCTLYVTLEPCPMCAGAIIQSRLERLVYGADDPRMGAVRSRYHLFDEVTEDGVPLLTVGIKIEQSRGLLRRFFENRR